MDGSFVDHQKIQGSEVPYSLGGVYEEVQNF